MLVALLIVAGCSASDDTSRTGSAVAPSAPESIPSVELPEAPPCTDRAAVTPRRSDGGHYRPGAPERASLREPGLAGTRLVIFGYVLFPDCRPVMGAVLDVWQADANGRYDDAGWRLRGILHSDDSGRYMIETIVPGRVDGADPVVHIKASEAPGGRILTTSVPVDDTVIRFDLVIEVG